MIRYDLICDNGHPFESWFAGSDAYDTQARRGFVTCPHCDCAKVSKQIMAPRLKRTDKRSSAEMAEAPTAPVALLDGKAAAMREMAKAFRAHVEANSQDVGKAFPEEARKIHYGESRKRSIRGEATLEDARELIEEGVTVLPMPVLPEDRN